jgi:hypothetical protein
VFAVLTALYLIVDDLITAFEGGNSVIADFYANLSGGRSLVEDLTSIWNGFVTVLDFVIGKFQSLWAMIEMGSKGLASIGGAAVSLVEDLMTAFQGGQSVIADFYSTLTGGRSIVQDLTRAFEVLGPLLGVVAGAFVAAKVGVIALNFALNANPIAKVVTAFALAATLIYANWEPIKEFFVSLWETIKGVAGSIANVTGGAIKFIGNLVGGGDTPQPQTQQIAGIGDTPQPQTQQMMQPAQTSYSRTSNVNQEVKIEVRSDNPEAAGKAVKTALDQQLTDAQLQNGAVAR